MGISVVVFTVEEIHGAAEPAFQGCDHSIGRTIHRLGNGCLFFFGEFAEHMADQTIPCGTPIISADADFHAGEFVRTERADQGFETIVTRSGARRSDTEAPEWQIDIIKNDQGLLWCDLEETADATYCSATQVHVGLGLHEPTVGQLGDMTFPAFFRLKTSAESVCQDVHHHETDVVSRVLISVSWVAESDDEAGDDFLWGRSV